MTDLLLRETALETVKLASQYSREIIPGIDFSGNPTVTHFMPRVNLSYVCFIRKVILPISFPRLNMQEKGLIK
jgi:hypothetical protein